MSRKIWVVCAALITFFTASAVADSFTVQVQGAGTSVSASPVQLSWSATSNNCPALGGCTAAIDASASAFPGRIGAYSSASLTIDSAYLQYNTSTHATALFREDGFTISGPSGAIYISFNYTIEGTLTAGGDQYVGSIASVDAFLSTGSSRGGYSYTLGGMSLDSGGNISSTGIFAGLQPQNASGDFVSPLIATFAGDPYVSFGMQIDTSAVAGTNGGTGFSSAAANFGHTLMFSANGPVVNVFDANGNNVTSLYDISTSDGAIVHNRFVTSTVPEPASFLLIGSGLLGLGGFRRRKRSNP